MGPALGEVPGALAWIGTAIGVVGYFSVAVADALVDGELAPAVDGFAEQRAEFGGVGGGLALDRELGVAGEGGAEGGDMRLEVDLDTIDALRSERIEYWQAVDKVGFLTTNV